MSVNNFVGEVGSGGAGIQIVVIRIESICDITDFRSIGQYTRCIIELGEKGIGRSDSADCCLRRPHTGRKVRRKCAPYDIHAGLGNATGGSGCIYSNAITIVRIITAEIGRIQDIARRAQSGDEGISIRAIYRLSGTHNWEVCRIRSACYIRIVCRIQGDAVAIFKTTATSQIS